MRTSCAMMSAGKSGDIVEPHEQLASVLAMSRIDLVVGHSKGRITYTG